MGKKYNNPKLMKSNNNPKQSMISAFNKFANKVTDSKKKKIEKVGDTKQRLLEAKKTNKMLKVSKRNSKFALLDDGQNVPTGLTHKGVNIGELKEFNDVEFGSEMSDEQFQKAHQNLNFTGFDQEQQTKKKNNEGKPKSQSQVYKQIIQKSKLHKHLRQQIYEQNLQKAVQLDEQFPQFVYNLQFRGRDSNVKQKLMNKDNEFQKLMLSLKEDERVVSNKVIEKNQKYTDKIRKKKAEQLNDLMKDSDEQQDVRTWVKNSKNKKNEDQEQNYDEIDEIQLSSGDQQDDDQEQQEQEDQQGDEQGDVQDEQQENEGQSEQEQEQLQEQELQQQVAIHKNKKNANNKITNNKKHK